MKITMDYSNSFVSEDEIKNLEPFIKTSAQLIAEKSGPGNEYLGWVDLPSNYDKEEFKTIKDTAKKIQEDSDVLLVIGIGGSYLGTRAVIDALSHTFYNNISKEKRKTPEIYYVGNNISSNYVTDLMDVIEGKDISINIISKSGTTTEPAIAFRIFKEYMENKYGKEIAKTRIYATTDSARGALKQLADNEGYKTFVIPDDVGGRYSVFTAVGLLPIATAGIDIDKMMEGAFSAMGKYSHSGLNMNVCYKYAAIRSILYSRGKDIEILVNYEPALQYLGEWWKQLFGESEGKDGKGIYPGSANFTTDLHSIGQIIQDGKRNLFETTINIGKSKSQIEVKANEEDLDGLNFLVGVTLDYINNKAFEGTMQAHVNGNVPNIVINIPELNEFYLGELIYFFEKACAISGYLLGVNPFDQPGVEEYKKNMFQLLGKPGY